MIIPKDMDTYTHASFSQVYFIETLQDEHKCKTRWQRKVVTSSMNSFMFSGSAHSSLLLFVHHNSKAQTNGALNPIYRT